MTYIAWKSDHVVRSDVDGNINVWEVKVTTVSFSSINILLFNVAFKEGEGSKMFKA